jgi:hypothetical protein
VGERIINPRKENVMQIGILNFIGFCLLLVFGSAVATFLVLKNNPGLVEGWAKDALAKKDDLLKKAQGELEKLKSEKK